MDDGCSWEWQSQGKAVSYLPHCSATTSRHPELEVACVPFSVTHWPITPTAAQELPSIIFQLCPAPLSLSLYNLHYSIRLRHTACGCVNWVWRGELLSSTWPADGGSKSPSTSCSPSLLCYSSFLWKFPFWSQGLQLTLFFYRMTVFGKSLCGMQ